jgi:GH25 family lysozyme M1 (1,4-beta-N-acetylmuramidase)
MSKNLLVLLPLVFLLVKSVKYNGIDVSEHQANIDFQKVKKSGINFVIMRAGIGHGRKDKYFEENYKKAKAAGLNVGAYWYSKAMSVADSTSEAKYVLNALKGKQFEYPIYYDIEEKSLFSKGKKLTSDIAKNFCKIMESKGYLCGIYASLSYFNNYFTDDVKKKFTIWVAQYNTHCDYKGDYKIWQKSSHGSVSGIKGRVDLDECYYDFPSHIKQKKLNGFK